MYLTPSAMEAALARTPPPSGGRGRTPATARKATAKVAASIQYTAASPTRPSSSPANAGPAVRPTCIWTCMRA
jgi:hypothetical protein